ncbi:hypothetical protein D3C76_1564830 [compost metagenome]
MEEVWPIAMDQHTMLFILVEAVATDMVALFQHQHLPAKLAGHSFSHDGARKPGANDDRLITHAASPKSCCMTRAGWARCAHAS